MKLTSLAAAAVALLTLSACNGGSTSSSAPDSAPGAAGGAKKIKVGIVFDSGGRGDKSFNDSAYAGIERAEKELGISADDVKTVDSKSEKDYEGNLTALADSGCDIVFAVGLAQNNALTKVAPKYANVKFAIVDAVVDQPNVRSIVFNEEQGSYLAGYVAALTSKSGKIGFVGGKKIPLIVKFAVGYEAGAKTSNPAIQVLPAKYTESWDDTATGKAAATTLFNDGADVVYHAAGRCGLGVISAAKDAGKFAIGVDSNQDDVAPGTVLTSMIKKVDEAVFQTVKDVQANAFTAGTKQYDLKANGVGLTDFKNTKTVVGQSTIDKVKAVAGDIASGKIKVPDTEEALTAYLATVKK